MADSVRARLGIAVLVFLAVTAVAVMPSTLLAATISCWGVEVTDSLDPARYCGYGGFIGFLASPAIGLLAAIAYMVWDSGPIRFSSLTKTLAIAGKLLATLGAVLAWIVASLFLFLSAAVECSGLSLGSLSCDLVWYGVVIGVAAAILLLFGVARFLQYVWTGDAPEFAFVAVTLLLSSAALLGGIALVASDGDSRPVVMETTTYATTTQPTTSSASPSTMPVTPRTTTVTTTLVREPNLTVLDPVSETVVATEIYTFVGMADPGCIVTAARRYAAEVGEDGMWSIDLVLRPGRNTATFVAEDQAGATTTVQVPVFYVPSEPDTAPLIGLVYTLVPSHPTDPLGAPNRVLDYDVEPPQRRDLWNVGGWLVDGRAIEPEWAVGLLTSTEPGGEWPAGGSHFVVLDRMIDRLGDGNPIWRIHDAVAIGELSVGEWVQECRGPNTTGGDPGWPAVGHVRGDPVEGRIEVVPISAWRIDVETGRLLPVDPGSVICVGENV